MLRTPDMDTKVDLGMGFMAHFHSGLCDKSCPSQKSVGCVKGLWPHAADGVKGLWPHAAGSVKLTPSPRSYGGTGRRAVSSINPGWHDFDCAPEFYPRQSGFISGENNYDLWGRNFFTKKR
jgi:hypothetical protein